MSHTGKISSNFSWEEVEKSETAERLGIDNTAPNWVLPAISNTALKMELVRALIGAPVIVNSWFRCPALQQLPQFYNPTSQHPRGEAVDFISPSFGPPLQIAKLLISQILTLNFDQLILEHSWIHISFSSLPQAKQRNQILSLLRTGGYSKGLTTKDGAPL